MKLLPVEYLGTTAMDKRFSTPMLPWVITEIRRRGTIDKICLGVEDGSLQAYDTNFEQQFSHRIQHMLRFSRAVHDARSFMYLLKDPVRPLLHCHLFKAARPDDVTELFNQMRDQGGQQAGGYMPAAGACSPPPLRHLPPQRSLSSAANLTSLCADISPSSSHFFEVLYIGKIKVSHKKVPDTFIDDALGKFQVHEQEKLLKGKISLSQIKRGQFNNETRRGSQDSASDTGSTESIVIHSNNSTLTSPMTPIDPIASIASLNLPKNFNAQSSIDHPNDTNKYESDKKYVNEINKSASSESVSVDINANNHINLDATSNSKSASLKRRQFSEEKYARGCTESSCADPTIKLERCDTFGTDAEMQIAEGRVRTISENNATVDNCIPSNLESSKSMSRSFENISMLDDSRGEEVKSVRLGVPIGPFIPNRKSGSIEALPTVAEDNPQTKDEPVRHDLRGRAASISGGSILRRQDSADHNRTMVFQVGRTDLRLISPDRKQILLHKQLKDVATCIQGLQNTEHFGFICREINVECFMGYIFKCQSDSVAVDVVQAITQAYTATAEGIKHREKPALVSCEHCPMVWYHKLCAEVDSQNDRKTQAIIFKRISFLDDEEQSTILTKFRGAETDSVREQNEFLMMLLRAHCEAKQSRHIHDTAENRSEFLNQYLGGSTIFMKAKRSLTNSFDHLLKRKGSRDDFGPQLREMNLPLSRETSPNTQTLETPSAGESDQISPMRSRASTLSSTNGDEKTPTILLTSEPSKEDKNQQLKSPMMDIFFKVGSSPKSPTRTQQMTSWRQEMFNKVVTPSKCEETNENKAGQKRSKEELRRLWKTAIHQALLLIRMEKENARLTARQEISAVKRIKLEYDEISHCPQDILQVWELLVSKESRISNKCDKQMLLQAIRQGVPRSKRGEVWHFLAHQFCLQQPPYDTTNFPNYNTPYETLLKQLTSHQHAILIDLGRTFPNHTYYSSPLGPGQLALFNLLKAYSLLDPEVGYCQGLSFVAGILLLHMPEDEAFFLLRHLMFRRGMRKQYLPDMEALQVHLYQLSRLLHDQAPEVYEHFNNHEVAPTLYAAPWILTIFASQFPLGFVTRVFDVLFLESPEVIFQVAVALLRYHKKGLMACESFEEIMDYLKNTIPAIDKKTMDIVLKELFTTDIKKSLNEYKVEYHVLQEEMASVRPQLDSLARLEHRNKQLMDQNQQLLEQLEIAMSNSQRLETTRSVHQSTINRLESQTRSLEVTVSTLGQFINSIIERKIDLEIPGEVRRIVSQIALSDRRRSATPKQNIGNIPNMKRLEPQRYMVKSLSMGKLGLNFNKTPVSDQVPRSNSVNVNLGTTLTQTLKQQDDSVRKNSLLSTMNENLSKIDTKGHKGFPLRVIDDNAIYEPIKSTPVKLVPKHPLKTALSQPILGAKSGFFANSHNHIQQQRMNSLALKQGLSDATATLMQSKIEEKLVSPKLIDTSNIPIEKSVSLPLEVKNSFQSDNLVKSDCKSDVSKDVSVDSGISTPMSPNSESTMCEIPLFDSDVTCTFNGTTKLKTIKSGVKCAKP